MLPLAIAFLLAVLPVPAAAPAVQPAPAPARPADPTPATGALPAWWSRVSAAAPGDFPFVAPYKASYRVTWEGVEAAHFDSVCSLLENGTQFSTLVKAQTTGLARSMWKFQATHLSVVDRRTLKPVRLEEVEDQGHAHSVDRVEFAPGFATRTSSDRGSGEKDHLPKSHRYDYPGLFDMESAFLYMRSLPLAVGESRTLPLMTSGSPYLATIKVVGHGPVQANGRQYSAYEYSVDLEKITKQGTLQPRKGFKAARAWVSDDANRIIVKAQADVFVGTVTVELENIRFTDEAAAR